MKVCETHQVDETHQEFVDWDHRLGVLKDLEVVVDLQFFYIDTHSLH